jgi:hypothetical protein
MSTLKKKTIEEKIAEREEAKKRYYELESMCSVVLTQMRCIKRFRGRSDEFSLLEISLNKFIDKVRKDFDRYEKRVTKHNERDIVADMQKSLNRERKLREALEKEIEDAKTSSGLFISYVRNKLKM